MHTDYTPTNAQGPVVALVARLSSTEIRWQQLVAGQVCIAQYAIGQWQMQQSRVGAGCNGRDA